MPTHIIPVGPPVVSKWLFLLGVVYLSCTPHLARLAAGEMRTKAPRAENDLYQRSCVRCHGKDGKGTETRADTPDIPDFTSHKWQEKRSDAQLLATIVDGKGKEMPAFGAKIGRDQAKELVTYVRQFDSEKSKRQSPSKEEKSTSPSRQEVSSPNGRASVPVTAEVQAARTLYQQRCARCHGTDGKGAEARATSPTIPDFTHHPWHERRTNAQLTATILDGKGKLMPAFGDKISPDQARNLVAFIRSVDPTSGPAAPDDDSDFENRFQELKQEMQSLQKQFRDLQSKPPKP